MKKILNLFFSLLPFLSSGQDTLWVDAHHQNIVVFRFQEHNVTASSPASFRLNNAEMFVYYKGAGMKPLKPFPFTFIRGLDTMRITVYFDAPYYRLIVNISHFISGNYSLWMGRKISNKGGGDICYVLNHAYTDLPFDVIDGMDWYAEDRVIMVDGVQWNPKENSPSPEYLSYFEVPGEPREMCLPISKMKFYNVHVNTQAVLIEDGKK